MTKKEYKKIMRELNQRVFQHEFNSLTEMQLEQETIDVVSMQDIFSILQEHRKKKKDKEKKRMTRAELLKIARPILFNTDMVRAILDGRKTATRRVLKLPSYVQKQENGLYTLFAEGTSYEKQEMGDIVQYLTPPYKKGDILYVRESVFQGLGRTLEMSGETSTYLTQDFEYYADGKHEKEHWKDQYEHIWMGRRPSIHMPKEAARIFLKVKDIRVERLQDITEKEARKEGFEDDIEYGLGHSATYHFANLWNSTIKKSKLKKYGWKANPWVWVIEFKRLESEEKNE